MTKRLMIPCDICKHYRGEIKCDAFPHGIPDEIYFLGFDHRKEYPGDNGIRFEPKQSCYYCENYIGNKKCLAFKKGIPEVILLGKFDHRNEYPGDKGYRFKFSKKLLHFVFREINEVYKKVLSFTREEREKFIKTNKEMLSV